MRPRLLRAAVPTALAVVLLTSCTGDGDDEGDESGGTLQSVQSADVLECGVNDQVPGFGFVDESGNPTGFDVDFCKALAAAVLGDAEKVEYTPLTAEQRLLALQGREIDVLIRNTTWTASRDGADGATFVTTNFYDGQGMMVRSDSGFESLEDLAGATICVTSGTTTERNLATEFAARGIDHEPLTFEDNEALQEAFEQERCDAWTSDQSQLAGIRAQWPDAQGGPEELTVLDEVFSKEPLGPAVRDGDSQWAQIVDWVVHTTVLAEELGITQANVQDMIDDDNPDVRRLLGGEDFESGLGFDDDFAVNIIEAVGNYGEIFDRHIGPDSPLGLERGLNALWTDGGLMYAPPFG